MLRTRSFGGAAAATAIAAGSILAAGWGGVVSASPNVTTPTAVRAIGLPSPGGHAGLYGWGAATLADGSVLIGDYWNYRIVHYNKDYTPATPFVFAGKKGFGPGTNQAPYGLGVDPFTGDVWMAEGSLADVNVYKPDGTFLTSYGTTNVVHQVAFTYPARVGIDPTSGTTHGMAYVVDQWAGDIQVIDPVTQSLHSTIGAGELIQPRGIAWDSAGNYWVGNQGRHRIDIFNSAGVLIKKILPPGGVGATFDMRGLTIDNVNKLAFVVNGQGCAVQEFNADPSSHQLFGAYIRGWGGCGTGNGQFEAGGREVTVDGNSHVWVGDLGGFRAQVFDEAGNFLQALPNPAAPPPTGGFNGPRGDTFDSSGNLFVTDTYNERIEKFKPDGSGGYTFDIAWGMRGDTNTTFNYPRLMCYDPINGYIIIANTDSNEIVAYDTLGHFKWAGAGLASPYGVACGADGTIYVADSNHKQVAVFNSSGVMSPTPLATNLGFVRGIWVDTDGSVWVDNMAANQVWQFSPAGAQLHHFSTGLASNPFGISGDATYIYIALSSKNVVARYTRGGTLVDTFGGPGKGLAQFHTPQGLAMGPNGHLYVVDQDNDRVTEWSLA